MCDSKFSSTFASLNEACVHADAWFCRVFYLAFFLEKTNLSLDLLINFFHGIRFGKDILSLVWSGICNILLEFNHVIIW